MRARALPIAAVLLAFLALPAASSAAFPVASGGDAVTAYFPVTPGFSSRAVVIAPDGASMVVEYAPGLAHLEPAVARIRFDGTVEARAIADPARVVPAAFFTVQGSLVGARADGTWTLVQPRERYPTGLQATIEGKTWDDVMSASDGTGSIFGNTASEPIEAGGSGAFASDLSTNVKTWNWHEQAAPRYDVGVLASENLQRPEQDPRLTTLR